MGTTTLTGVATGVSFADATGAILAIAGTLAILYAIIKGAHIMLGMIRR